MVSVTEPDPSQPSVPNGQVPHTGQRGRIRRPTAPAPDPTRREPRRVEQAPDLSRSPREASAIAVAEEHTDDSRPRATDRDVVRSTGSMAIATLISRITGFVRNAMIGAALGGGVASAFNVANTLPNLITEIVLGAVLTSLVIPVLVRAEKEDDDHGETFVRRLFTAAMSILIVVTVIAVIGAPFLTRMMLSSEGQVNVDLSTSFAVLLLPQILFYGVFALLMAVLNTKGVFKPGAWAPVANNIIAIATLSLYIFLPGPKLNDGGSSLFNPYVLLLGIGTTLGVVLQAAIMIPPLRKAGVNLKPLWGIDARVKQFAGMGIAIIAYVAVSQLGYVITMRIASVANEAAPLQYQQAWLLLQVPYGIIGVTLLTAIMPRLSRNASDGDNVAVIRDLNVGTKLTMLALVPIVVFFTFFGQQIANALFAYGQFTSEQADVIGWTLSFSAFTLIPYALVLLHLRVFYAREEAWTPTFIIIGITVVKVLLTLLAPLMATEPYLVVVLLGGANGFGYIAGAVIGVLLLRRTLGSLNGKESWTTSIWAFGAALIAAIIAFGFDYLLGMTPLQDLGSIGYFIRVALSGILFLTITGLVLMRSPLPEVRTVGSMLGRIPGLRRFAPAPPTAQDAPDLPDASDMIAGGADPLGVANDGIIGSPLLPPLPTEAARAPRFVPGEIIGAGRYRLISETAKRDRMRMWRAQDLTSPDKDEISFTYIEAADKTRSIAEMTRALKPLEGPGLTRIREVHTTRTTVIVISDWVAGAPLNTVASEAPNPEAAALAASDLFEAVARSREAEVPLGIDNADRLRVNVDGHLVLAYPAPLPGANTDEDLEGATRALEMLLRRCCEEIPEGIETIAENARTTDPAVTAQQLRDAAYGDGGSDLSVEPEAADSTSGRFLAPAQAMSRKKQWGVGVSVVGLSLVGAVGAATIYAQVNQSENAPLSQDSLRRGTEIVENVIASDRQIASVNEWQLPTDNPLSDLDNPESAGLAADGDLNTSWSSSEYLEQFAEPPLGFKQGIGLVVTLDAPATPTSVEIVGTDGVMVQVYAVEDGVDMDSVSSLDELTEVGEARLGESPGANGNGGTETPTTTATTAENDGNNAAEGDPGSDSLNGTVVSLTGAPQTDRLLIWVSELPMEQPNLVEINEVAVRARG